MSDNCDKRKKASGAAFRKAAVEKREKETNFLKTVKKVDSFFIRKEKVVENVISQTKNQSQGEEVCNDIATSSTADNENYTNDMPIHDNVAVLSEPNDDNYSVNINRCETGEELELNDSNGNGSCREFVSDDPSEWTVNDATINILLQRGIKQNKD